MPKMIKRVAPKNLEVGKRYWIVRKGLDCSEFRNPLLFIGYKQKRRTPWFTFGDCVENWWHEFNYTAPTRYFNFYEEV